MRPLLFALAMILASITSFSQSILEQFEDEADNATSFTANGVAFTLTGQLHIENFATLGVGPSLQYVDNSNFCPGSNAVGTQGTLYTTSKQNILIDTIYIFPSINCVDHSTTGSIILNGYRSGSLVASSTTSSFTAPVYATWLNGFTKLSLPFGSTSVDSIAFVTTGSLKYVAIDQLVFRKVVNTWTGGSNTSWSNTANWSDNAVPATRDDITIPGSLSNYPTISSGTVSCRNLTISSGASLIVNGGTLQISGTITNSGTLTATNGTIVLNDASYTGYANLTTQTPSTIGPTAQTISGSAFTSSTIKNLTLNNTAGATVSSTLNITDTYTPTAGTLTTGGNLVLKSTASGTARIAAGSSGGGYISGNAIIERFMPSGKRALRLYAHPFTSTQLLSSLTDDIDITGSGGSTNGFTTVTGNAESSYWFNVNTADNTPSRANLGWTPFTSAISSSGNNGWAQYQGISVLYRGIKGEGLGAAVTPSANTLDMTGALNQGNQTVTVTKGASSTLVLIGNPYMSNINLNLTTRGSNIGSSFYTWDAYSGTKGAYVTNAFSSSYILASFMGFFVTTSANSNNTITFHETDKSSSSPSASLFKTTGGPDELQNGILLKLYSDNETIKWDEFRLYFDNRGTSDSEWYDAFKLYNPDASMYSFAHNGTQLAIDVRPYVEGEIIPMGLVYAKPNTYKLKTEEFEMPAGTKLFLHDKFLEKTVELKQGDSYEFDVTSNVLSQGDNRFELQATGNATSNNLVIKGSMKMKLVPNPASDNVTVYYEGLSKGNVYVTLHNMVGVKVAAQQQPANQSGSMQLSLKDITSGVYILTLQNDNQTITQRLVKR
jgi:hypothetical protein